MVYRGALAHGHFVANSRWFAMANLLHGVESHGALALVGLPIPVCLGALAPWVAPFFFGAHWHESILVLQILAMQGILQAIGTNSGTAYLTLDKLHLTTLISSLRLAILTPLLLLLTPHNGAADAARHS
jgi:O-antigen/teichoic acid export membrane protein